MSYLTDQYLLRAHQDEMMRAADRERLVTEALAARQGRPGYLPALTSVGAWVAAQLQARRADGHTRQADGGALASERN
ncbi:MAG: hypothetical protein GYB67_16645 [Chloroflexi bacterium]|nr:hypothetical protein [Chloroflexota bacterium]